TPSPATAPGSAPPIAGNCGPTAPTPTTTISGPRERRPAPSLCSDGARRAGSDSMPVECAAGSTRPMTQRSFIMANFVIKSALSLAALASLLALVPAAPAEAQNVKSWVANTGSDANDCTLAHPCATLAHAHDRTNPGGEVGVLTPGDYRVVTPLAIDRSIHITNDGAGEASILQPGSIGVDIQSNLGRGDIVSLRGLVIDGQGTGQMGIQSTGRATLHMQNCVIRNFVVQRDMVCCEWHALRLRHDHFQQWKRRWKRRNCPRS